MVRLDGVDRLVIWYSDEIDGFVEAHSGQFAWWSQLSELQVSCRRMGISLGFDPPAVYDFDHISRWCEFPLADQIVCDTLLNAWNFLDDLVRSQTDRDSAFGRVNRSSHAIYAELVRGCNLPALMTSDDPYSPDWSVADCKALAHIMNTGIEHYRTKLTDAGHVTF